MRVETSTQNDVYYLHGDHLGSASLATDSHGAVVPNSPTRYYPSGETRYGGGGLPTDWRFTGQIQEESLGLYDYGARFYDPSLNRFISADTIVPSPGNPQSLNRYSYVLNNALKYTDPMGHRECNDPNDCPVPNPFANPYGIRFTADAGKVWTSNNVGAVFDAVGTIAFRLTAALRRENWLAYKTEEVPIQQFSPATVFKQVFGAVTFNLNSGNCDGGTCWARADRPRGTVQVYIQNVTNGVYTALNAAHELGHTFDWRAGYQPRSDLSAEWNANPNFPRRDPTNRELRGYAGRRFTWQQSNELTASEEFADMFLGWAYNQWGPGDAGRARSLWMTTNMAGWIH